MEPIHSPLRLNVGFLIKESAGYSRVFPFSFRHIRLFPDLDLDSLVGNAEIGRTPQGLLVQASFAIALSAECVRCLQPFLLQLNVHLTELYASSKRHLTESGLLLPEDGFIDLAPLVREFAILEIPINPICKVDCKGLCPECGENRNVVDCGHFFEQRDSRFNDLRKLLND